MRFFVGQGFGPAAGLRPGAAFSKSVRACLPGIFLLLLSSCGYHVAGTTNLLPAEIHTIAVTPFRNASIQHKLSDYLTEAVVREMISRTHYKIVADPAQADAVLTGAVANMFSSAVVADPVTGRSTGAQVVVIIQAKLTDKSGTVLYNDPSHEYRERYEISVNPQQYFDESPAALQRLSKDVARDVVSSILDKF
jgi:outer membrane lipopolysaccharide assembly protein LptE/RlpB